MKRRILSLMLVFVLVACMIPVSAFAVTEHVTSDACIEVIKAFEGFAKYPYEDNGQYSVGYGTRCPDEDLERYMNEGITVEEATELLKEFIASFENYVNNFASKYSLELTQSQFDALVSFTYNVGNSWMNDTEAMLTQAIIDQATGNELIFALTMWCVSGGQISTQHINRRHAEANMYLNGVYSKTPPASYSYVLFDHLESLYKGEKRSIRVQGYDSNDPTEIYPVALKDGYRFLGWYTAAEGGKWISMLDASTAAMRLYPHWQNGEGDAVNGTPASYQRELTEAVNVYAAPSRDAAVVYTMTAGLTVNVVADYVTADAEKWGKLEDGNWLPLGTTGAAGSLDEDELPGVDFDDPDEDLGEVIATGTVNSGSTGLNIRSGAGTGYAVVGTLANGTRVEIYEIVTVDGVRWGRVAKGWISLDYVILDGASEETVPPTEETVPPTEETVPPTEETVPPTEETVPPTEETVPPTEETVPPTEETVPPTEETVPPTEETVPPTEETVPPADKEEPIATGTIKTTSGNLNVRSGPGSSYDIVDKLASGTHVEIYEITTVDGTQWGRIAQGWISMDYVVLDEVELTLDAPVVRSCYSQQKSSVKVTWTTVEGAEGYELYRTTNPGDPSTWALVKTINDGAASAYTNQGLTEGVTYYYRVRAFAAGSDSTIYSDFSNVEYMPAAVVFGNVYSNGADRVRLNWDVVDGAHGYQIWRKTGDGSWKIVKTLGDRGNTLTSDKGSVSGYTNNGLASGVTYTYKMRAFKIENGKKVFGVYSDEISVAVKPQATTIAVTTPKAGRAQVSWDAVNGAAGYQIWMADAADGTYKIVKTITNGTTSYTKYDLTSGQTYYFKVRAYAEVNGHKSFSAYSDVASVTVK